MRYLLAIALFLLAPSLAAAQTSQSFGQYVSTLPTATTPPNNADVFYIFQKGTSKQIPYAALFNGTVLSLGNGQILIGQPTGVPLAETVSGDATLTSAGVLSVKTVNGVPFPSSYTAGFPLTGNGAGLVGQVSPTITINSTPCTLGSACSVAGGGGGIGSGTTGQIPFYAGNGAALTATSAVPNGITATTQSPGDNTTKVATDAFVLANAVTTISPSTATTGFTSGDIIGTTGGFLADTGIPYASVITAPLTPADITNGASGRCLIADATSPTYNYCNGSLNLARNSTMTSFHPGCSSGISSPCTITTAGGWCAEGIFIVPTGASVTCYFASLNTGLALGNGNAMIITGASSVTDVKLRFVQESVTAQRMYGGNVTFQLIIANLTGGSITPTISTLYPSVSDNWGATNTADLAATNMQPCANSAFCREAYTWALGSNNITVNGYEEVIDLGNNFSTTGKSIYIAAGFDLRATPGTTTGINNNPAQPELPNPQADIAWNQRYFQWWGNNSVMGNAAGINSTSAYCTVSFLSQMWEVPTMAISSTAITVNATTSSAVGFTQTTNQNARLSVSVASGLTTAGAYQCNVNGNGALTADATISGG